MRRDELFLLDILEACDRIASRIAGRELAAEDLPLLRQQIAEILRVEFPQP